MPKAIEVANLLASKPPVAMKLTKQWLREMTLADFEHAFEKGAAIQAAAYESGEPQAEMRKFFEERAKRKT
jgi:enoyl-CoA hydratase/carnithine racemase